MARNYKRDGKGRFARVASKAKKRYQKGHSGPGAKYRRQRDKFRSAGAYSQPSNQRLRKTRNIHRKASVVVTGAYFTPVYAISGARHARAKSNARRAVGGR